MEAHRALQQDATSVVSGSARPGFPYDRLKVRDVITTYDQLKSIILNGHTPTAEHSIRVRIFATSLGFACRLSSSELTALSIAAEIHDIGKLQVPAAILDKEDKLSETDWSIMRKHPVWGARVAALAFPSMLEVAHFVLLHHERLDGSGYPNALWGSAIPFQARILAVADVFAALTEDRVFRVALGKAEALCVLMHDEKGKYDKDILELLARLDLSR